MRVTHTDETVKVGTRQVHASCVEATRVADGEAQRVSEKHLADYAVLGWMSGRGNGIMGGADPARRPKRRRRSKGGRRSA